MNGPNLNCRFCDEPLTISMLDLGLAPLANSYLKNRQAIASEKKFPLNVRVCSKCLLAQLGYFVDPESIFTDYAYLSSYSSSWLAHAKAYVDLIQTRFQFKKPTSVVEIGSNDGYLLQYFAGPEWQVLGLEPAANVAQIANQKGIPTKNTFFNAHTVLHLIVEQGQADLIIANNVMAHVPDINEFVVSLKLLLAPEGLITIEVPHLLSLMQHSEFDTIYHEHYYYFSFLALQHIFERHELKIVDVDKLDMHGGSLRLYIRHFDFAPVASQRVMDLLQEEWNFGLQTQSVYEQFGKQVADLKHTLVSLLEDKKLQGMRIACYGAPAKGNTLLSYCGLTEKIIDFTVDKNPIKQNQWLPGSHIPIYSVTKIKENKPDYVLILPWNLRDEIMSEVAFIKDWGGQFICPIPEVKVLE